MTNILAPLLEKLVETGDLSPAELTQVFEQMLSSEMSEALSAGFLTAWRAHGESSETLATGARFLRDHASKITVADNDRPLSDNCGTGGSGINKFNISTTAAVVAASCGLKIAKHGNRAISSRCGSADLLFALGFPENLSKEKALGLLNQTGFTFFFAPNFHPLMKHVMPVRKHLGIRTVFNLLGPLANPLAPDYQLLGVGHKSQLRPMAEALTKLGVTRALVVHSRDGIDELSPDQPSDGYFIEKNQMIDFNVDPKRYGVYAPMADLQGGEAKTNVAIFESVLDGKLSAYLEAVVLNAGCLLWVSERTQSIAEGINLARTKLSDSSTKRFFQDWLEVAQT